ncbi:PLDc N-terminal domain-containing protein [Aeromicrobium sp.]|uniref:PLDc N-terminal domain-containing protein n=1 Tax=Aeromicrobium sp. TaxID=1871063 RepID=UPI002FCC27E2
MGKFVIIAFAIILLVFAIFDLVATPKERVRILPKPVWFLILFFAPVGPLLWLLFGRQKPAAPPKPSSGGGWTPPPGPKGPDDDPDYLRGL